MKTIYSILTALLLLTASPAMASQNFPVKANSGEYATDVRGVRSQISRLLTFASDKITNLEGEVNLILRVGAHGRVEVLDISGDNAEVVSRVESVLEQSRLLVDPQMVGKSFRIGIDYDRADA
jgi:hypothetical protein